jgi:acyl-ACP thioesterase
MSIVPPVWKEQRRIESLETDLKGRLKPHILYAFLLESAWKHAEPSQFGYEELVSRGLMWVMMKLQLSILRMPRWGERITIETWGKGIERLYALRDFAVRSMEGEKLASATSAWMILDRNTYRPQRLDRLNIPFPWEPGKSEMDTRLGKIPEAEQYGPDTHFRVLFTDIDVNRHVSAVKYLQWIIDSHPSPFLEDMHLTSVEIGYLAEAVLGDDVSVGFAPADCGEICRIRRTRDGMELCRARLEWRPEGSRK